ncbi:MAG: ArsA family ATPase [Acidobacteria bacterium]|nr:ArsA family ATPase [Acidobacteriota bacterium]
MSGSGSFAKLPKRLVFVGSGGVGKTTLAASLAVHFAAQGERTLVMTFDPSLRLKDALGIGDSAGSDPPDAREAEVRVALSQAGDPQAGGELYAHLLDARRTFDRLIHRYAPDDASRDRILGNRFFRHLAGRLAGILEYMAVERLYEAVKAERFDRIILDTPPTREALEFLDAPQRIVSFLDSGALRVALKPWFDQGGHFRPKALPGLGMPLEALLDRMVGIDLLRDMAEFFQAFAPLFDGFRERALEVEGLLQSRDTGFVLVTAPAERNLAGTMFFARHLTERSHNLVAVIANRVHPAPGAPSSGGADGPEKTEIEGLELMRWLGERDRDGIAHLKDLLAGGPAVVSLPLLAASPTDLPRLAALGRTLESAWVP